MCLGNIRSIHARYIRSTKRENRRERDNKNSYYRGRMGWGKGKQGTWWEICLVKGWLVEYSIKLNNEQLFNYVFHGGSIKIN